MDILDDRFKYYEARLSKKNFDKLSSFIYNNYGIKMPPSKQIMLQSRLHKRLRALKIDNFDDYVNFVFSPQGKEEIIHMIDVVSTNKTDFFREKQHFDYLTQTLLPELYGIEKHRFLKIWSAGCSSGEEVYTLAIVMSEFKQKHPDFDFSIFGSDISSIMLQKAIKAIYPEEEIEIIPYELKKKYFLRSKDPNKKLVRVIPELRKKATFGRINFMSETYNTSNNYDIIFCRNVLIYFDRKTQEEVINKLSNHVRSGGYLFLGHSESITGLKVNLEQVKPTIYRVKN